ncbi:MAG: hypothetical protein ACI9N9_000320 [Enterobacterales bacterium]|jgi:hypothetical protein
MRAVVMFDRDALEWHLVQLNLTVDFVMSLDRIKRGFSSLGRVRFPYILEVELKSFKVTGEKSYSWSSNELPKTPSIKECIAKNKADILLVLNKLNRR